MSDLSLVDVFSVNDRILAIRLGVGDLIAPERCWGFAQCCNCNECLGRERLLDLDAEELVPALQPWEARSRAA